MSGLEHDPPDSVDASVGAQNDDAPPPSRIQVTWATLRTRASALRCLLAGGSAWLITLAPVALSPRAGLPARAMAVLALLACVGGSQMMARDPRLARVVGITVFVALSLGSWLLASRAGVLAAIDSFRGVLGVLAWAIYAVSWSHPWSLPDARLKDAPLGDALDLKPRRKTPQVALVVAGAGTAAAVVCIALAWRVDEPARAVFAQAIATAAAIALLTASAAVASVTQKEERPTETLRSPIDGRVVRTLLVLGLVAGAAVALYLLR